MIDKFKEKYRTETTRLKGWNYASGGYYFVTICEKNRSFVFGDICNDTVSLTPLGRAAMSCWTAIPEHFPFVELDAFCIMPNYVHGIIIINSGVVVETQNLASLQGNETGNKFGPQSRNLASIVRGFKIGVTKYARANDIDFAWQPRYYDRIIRDEQELFAVRTYIRNNPVEWELDEYATIAGNSAICRDAKFCVSTGGDRK
jgi:REP element-mobilizing transposase RayT